MKWRCVVMFVIVIMFIYNNVSGQIELRKIERVMPVASQTYDGTKNFLGKDAYQYVGQELYLKPLSVGLQETGYKDFVKDYTKPQHGLGLLGLGLLGRSTSNVYNCCSDKGDNSNYKKMAGRYFKVLEVIPHPKAKESISQYGSTYFFKLQAKDNSDILFYQYDAQFESAFPFIVVGFFEKQKRDLVGKEYVIRGKNWWSGDKPLTDINTGQSVELSAGSIWKGVDFVIEERFEEPVLILQNNKGKQVFIMHQILTDTSFNWIFKKEDADRYRAMYGDENWDLILRSKVKQGMTMEMCRLSWGKPQYINKTAASIGTREEWVYSTGNYLYFNGDKLSGSHSKE